MILVIASETVLCSKSPYFASEPPYFRDYMTDSLIQRAMATSPAVTAASEIKSLKASLFTNRLLPASAWIRHAHLERDTNSETDGRDASHASAAASGPSPLSKFNSPSPRQVTSPYLSESAHVLSLQNPIAIAETGETNGSVAAVPLADEGAAGEEGKQGSSQTIVKPQGSRSRSFAQLNHSNKSSANETIHIQNKSESQLSGIGHSKLKLATKVLKRPQTLDQRKYRSQHSLLKRRRGSGCTIKSTAEPLTLSTSASSPEEKLFE
ncbi:uncharacterized protein UV8b_03633 [Ustilaginoidea virens]|uniref:Uncharacterized protein n=1 Tax=Ustilaginoidea virens TaxID=1159556 RepID=A0A8E5HQ17_USTVR|nr:uncharacterized protein UV8b_03633 [Ustilaginoidea virens]QUC19392.1 hypothetical protein UV8b_03633 [Ustilaginoidea virens]